MGHWRQARMPFNVIGQPARVIPAGFTKGGLPLSLQLIGHPFAEATVYRAIAAYEAEMGSIKRHPPGLAGRPSAHRGVPAVHGVGVPVFRGRVKRCQPHHYRAIDASHVVGRALLPPDRERDRPCVPFP
jgi:amidase